MLRPELKEELRLELEARLLLLLLLMAALMLRLDAAEEREEPVAGENRSVQQKITQVYTLKLRHMFPQKYLEPQI